MRFLEGVEKEQSLILCVILIRIQAFFEIPVCCNLVSCVTHNDNLSWSTSVTTNELNTNNWRTGSQQNLAQAVLFEHTMYMNV